MVFYACRIYTPAGRFVAGFANFFPKKHSRQRAAPWGICQKRLTALPFYPNFIILLECFQMVSKAKKITHFKCLLRHEMRDFFYLQLLQPILRGIG